MSNTEAPERIWMELRHFRSRSMLVGDPALSKRSESDIEYARVDPPAAPRRVSEMAEKKTADVRHKPETVDELVEYLFTNGSRHRGQRLILVDEDYSGSAQVTKASNLGGWSRLAIRDVIKDFMERQ